MGVAYSFTSAAISSTRFSISVRLNLIPLLRKASAILLRVSSPLSGANKIPAAAPTCGGCRPPAFARRTLCVGVAARRDAAIPFGGSRAALSCSLDGGLFHAPARGAAYPCGVLHDARTGSGACTSDYRTRRPGLLYGGLPPSDGGFLP